MWLRRFSIMTCMAILAQNAVAQEVVSRYCNKARGEEIKLAFPSQKFTYAHNRDGIRRIDEGTYLVENDGRLLRFRNKPPANQSRPLAGFGPAFRSDSQSSITFSIPTNTGFVERLEFAKTNCPDILH